MIKTVIVTFIFGFLLDMLWLAVIAKDMYDKHLGYLLRKSGNSLDPIWWSAGAVYLAIIGGIFYFALPKADAGAMRALLNGVIFGLVTYSIYEFTNYALVAKWPLGIVIVDVIWGMVLCGSITLVAYLARGWFTA